MAAIDRDNWAQFWFSQPGESNRHACIWWFRLTGARTFGLTSASFVPDLSFNAALRLGPLWLPGRAPKIVAYIKSHGNPYQRFTTVVPPPAPTYPADVLPYSHALVVHRRFAAEDDKYHARLLWSPVRSSYLLDGGVNAPTRAAVDGWNHWLTSTYTYHDWGFVPIVVSFKHSQWYDVEKFECAERVGVLRRRSAPRSDRISLTPKLLPP